MNEEFFTDTRADVFGSNPHMFEFGLPISDNKSVETYNLAFTLCHIDLIVADEIGGYSEVLMPMLNPVLWITPMPFRVVSDLSQSSGFVG
jgi:hypothetical protein